jgi:hypothetical protein
MESSLSLCVCNLELWDLSSNECTLPFIVQGECLHCAGPRQVGPANRGRSTRDKEVFSSSSSP